MITTSLRGQTRTGWVSGTARRGLAALLLLSLGIGAFALWVGVPAAVLWSLGKLSSNQTEHLLLGLIAVPLAMVLFGLLLALVNTAYLQLGAAPVVRSADESEWKPRLRGPLDRIIGISAAVCLLTFLGWLLFGSAGVGPAGPW